MAEKEKDVTVKPKTKGGLGVKIDLSKKATERVEEIVEAPEKTLITALIPEMVSIKHWRHVTPDGENHRHYDDDQGNVVIEKQQRDGTARYAYHCTNGGTLTAAQVTEAIAAIKEKPAQNGIGAIWNKLYNGETTREFEAPGPIGKACKKLSLAIK